MVTPLNIVILENHAEEVKTLIAAAGFVLARESRDKDGVRFHFDDVKPQDVPRLFAAVPPHTWAKRGIGLRS